MANRGDSEFHTSNEYQVRVSNLKGVIKHSGGTYMGYLQELDGKENTRMFGPVASLDLAMETFQKMTKFRVLLVAPKNIDPRASKDDAILEGLRIDPTVSDVRYRSSCHALKQKPKERPNFAPPVVTVPINPYPVAEQLEIFTARFISFSQQNAFVNPGGRVDLLRLNMEKIAKWLEAEKYSVPDNKGGMTEGPVVTKAVLTEAVKDLGVCGMLHTSESGIRGFKRVVKPYSYEAILKMRQGIAEPVEPVAAPVSPAVARRQVEQAAFQEARAQFPKLNPQSGEFRAKVDEIIRKQASPSRYDKSARMTGEPTTIPIVTL